jgi:hypothetical protein
MTVPERPGWHLPSTVWPHLAAAGRWPSPDPASCDPAGRLAVTARSGAGRVLDLGHHLSLASAQRRPHPQAGPPPQFLDAAASTSTTSAMTPPIRRPRRPPPAPGARLPHIQGEPAVLLQGPRRERAAGHPAARPAAHARHRPAEQRSARARGQQAPRPRQPDYHAVGVRAHHAGQPAQAANLFASLVRGPEHENLR